MLIAGTLGTVIGDAASFETGLGTTFASVTLGALFVATLLLWKERPSGLRLVPTADQRPSSG
jgi:uncharacterized membrane-anchored protein